jgi:hypothetical protein
MDDQTPTVETQRVVIAGGRNLPLNATALIALFIGGVIVVATLIVLVGGAAHEVSYPPDSPEAAVQGFLRAYYNDDAETAYSFLSTRVRKSTSLNTYTQQCCYAPDRQEVRVNRVTGTGETRQVFLDVANYWGGSEPDSHIVIMPMVLEDAGWRIDRLFYGTENYDAF